jgi:hypothetical protein
MYNNLLNPRSRSTGRFQQENTENQWKHGSSIPAGKYSDFFHWLLASFPFFPPGNARKSPEKIQKFSGWNTASMFYYFPKVSCRIQSLFRLVSPGSSEIPVISSGRNHRSGSLIEFNFVECKNDAF